MGDMLTTPLISVILTSISTVGALFTAYYSYKAIKVNKELFNKTQEAEERRLLPLFDVYMNNIFLDEKGRVVRRNPNLEGIISLSFVNINHNSIANIVAIDAKKNDENVSSIITSKLITAINYTADSVILNIRKKELEDKDYKIEIKYLIQTNKVYVTEIIFSVSYGVWVSIKKQTSKEQIEAADQKKSFLRRLFKRGGNSG